MKHSKNFSIKCSLDGILFYLAYINVPLLKKWKKIVEFGTP